MFSGRLCRLGANARNWSMRCWRAMRITRRIGRRFGKTRWRANQRREASPRMEITRILFIRAFLRISPTTCL